MKDTTPLFVTQSCLVLFAQLGPCRGFVVCLLTSYPAESFEPRAKRSVAANAPVDCPEASALPAARAYAHAGLTWTAGCLSCRALAQ